MAHSKIILLADDDLDDAEMFAETLAHIDSSVKFYHVKNGLGVFDHLKQPNNQRPDIIFLDINMPEMSGWQCLTTLKNDPLTKDIPVLIYSTSSHHRDKQTALELGASAFITKPSDYKKLQHLLSIITANLHKDIKSISSLL
jgi:CheY-like chemotaxis protein